MPASPQALSSTLILALTQTQALQHELEEKTRVNEHLTRENSKLRRELDELRPRRSPAADLPLSVQLDELFKKDVEKQAEIDDLKAKLRVAQAKERKWRLQHPKWSLPPVSSDEAEATNALPRKRPRSASPECPTVLQELPRNALNRTRRPEHKIHRDHGAEAIPTVAEDGENHNPAESEARTQVCQLEPKSGSPQRRLQDLLTGSTPRTPLLPRSSGSSGSGRGRAATPKPDTTTPSTDPPQAAVSVGPGPTEPGSAISTSIRKPPFLAPQPRPAPAPEDEEPFRSRPLHRLNLSHFKVNPAHTGGRDYAFDEVIRGRAARKCLPGCMRMECCGRVFKALATTLPAEGQISDDALLQDFLGPGSEHKILALTALARENLLHEARATRLSNLHGRLHRGAFDRPHSPPGFWDTDMPGSQEQSEYREQSKHKERKEVDRRHREAERGDGRWMFADE